MNTANGDATPQDLIPLIAAGSQVVVRDEEWLVRSTQPTPSDGLMIRCLGTSVLVRDTEATFFTSLDFVEPLRPEETRIVNDDSPQFRRSRLFLEAMIRKTPIPATETSLTLADRHLLQQLSYQQRAAHKAIDGLRPRLLIADAVGLGKTLEVGMILSELIRRGRGDRILVVTPRHILEQFQHELWTRFAIPLVRLDSEGIQRVRRQIPANRNPFTHYKRVIISIDTLKNAGRYRHHLEGIRWDAVVIDECHNLVNKGTLNNQLAHVLAPRTEALLLTSATPHNGDPKSFAELVRLLDPTAIADETSISESDIAHLYVRRHKHHDDVAAEVSGEWADRLEPRAVLVEASAQENAVFAELNDTWIHPKAGTSPTSGKGRSLFPWTLFKAALSSHAALQQTVVERRRTLANQGGRQATPAIEVEDDALSHLEVLASAIDDASSSKLEALIENLREIGVAKRSKTRVVVFSERIATLDWLAATVPDQLGLSERQIRVLHGGMADVKQMDVIEEFGLADSDVRLLFTGDMAAEGVNLHRQCHHLIHFDLPWSLITIEQRNGRIDRYGQHYPPDVRALVQVPDNPLLTGDVRILTKLLEREHQAHQAFGDSGSLLGLHDVKLEERAIIDKISEGLDPETAIPSQPVDDFDLLALISGATSHAEVPTMKPPTLFDSDWAYVEEALRAAVDRTELDLRPDPDDATFLSLNPPADLVNRFRALPRSYLSEQRVTERLKLTADPVLAEEHLVKARESTSSTWPEIGFLSPLHPFVDWITDKVLVAHGRNEAPVIVADVDRPWFCLQGMFSNGRGQPQIVEWLAVTEFMGEWQTRDLFDVLTTAKVSPTMPNPGRVIDVDQLEQRLGPVIAAARQRLDVVRQRHDEALDERLAEPSARLEAWLRESERLAFEMVEQRQREVRKRNAEISSDTRRLIASMRTAGTPLLRVLAVLVPPDQPTRQEPGQ